MIVLSSAINRTLKHKAKEIKCSLTPSGYSAPSALVLIFSSWFSWVIGSSFSTSWCTDATGEGDKEPSLVASAGWLFSVKLAFALLSVSDVESSMVFISQYFAIREDLSAMVKCEEVVDANVAAWPFCIYARLIQERERALASGE